jgi:hypothetical protein
MANFVNFYNLVKQDIDRQKQDFNQSIMPLVNSVFEKRIFDLQKEKEEQKADKEKIDGFKLKLAEQGVPWNEAWNDKPLADVQLEIGKQMEQEAITDAEVLMPEVMAEVHKNPAYEKMSDKNKLRLINTTASRFAKNEDMAASIAEFTEKEKIRHGFNLSEIAYRASFGNESTATSRKTEQERARLKNAYNKMNSSIGHVVQVGEGSNALIGEVRYEKKVIDGKDLFTMIIGKTKYGYDGERYYELKGKKWGDYKDFTLNPADSQDKYGRSIRIHNLFAVARRDYFDALDVLREGGSEEPQQGKRDWSKREDKE